MPPFAASRLPLAVLAVLVVVGAALRIWQARESLWLDELHTAWCALGSLAEVAPRATIGNQSPLFFWLVWLLVQVFGPSELTVRLPSLVAGSFLPAALWWLTVRWTRQPWLGVLAAWLVVVDPIQIFYATEARPYAMVQLLAVVHVGLLVELLVRPRLGLHLAFIGVGAAMFHLHYTAALLFHAEIAAIAFLATGKQFQATPEPASSARSTASLLSRDFLFIAVLCLPAMPHVISVFERRANWELFIPQPTLTSLVTLLPWTWTALIVLAGQAASLSLFAGQAASLPIFVGQASRLSRNANTSPDSDDRVPALVALAWLLVPLMIAWILARTDIARLFFLRYLMISAPAAIMLAVLAVRMLPSRVIQVAAGAGIALFALCTVAAFQLATDGRLIAQRHGDWRSAIVYFNEQPEHGRFPVLVATQLIESEALRDSSDPALAEYCLFPVHSLYPIDADAALTTALPRTSPGQLAPPVRELVASRGGAWLIFAGSAAAADDAARQMAAILAEGGQRSEVRGQRSEVRSQREPWQVTSRHSFGTVHVILLRQH